MSSRTSSRTTSLSCATFQPHAFVADRCRECGGKASAHTAVLEPSPEVEEREKQELASVLRAPTTCDHFVPHAWVRDRCRECGGGRDEHTTMDELKDDGSTTTTAVSLNRMGSTSLGRRGSGSNIVNGNTVSDIRLNTVGEEINNSTVPQASPMRSPTRSLAQQQAEEQMRSVMAKVVLYEQEYLKLKENEGRKLREKRMTQSEYDESLRQIRESYEAKELEMRREVEEARQAILQAQMDARREIEMAEERKRMAEEELATRQHQLLEAERLQSELHLTEVVEEKDKVAAQQLAEKEKALEEAERRRREAEEELARTKAMLEKQSSLSSTGAAANEPAEEETILTKDESIALSEVLKNVEKLLIQGRNVVRYLPNRVDEQVDESGMVKEWHKDENKMHARFCATFLRKTHGPHNQHSSAQATTPAAATTTTTTTTDSAAVTGAGAGAGAGVGASGVETTEAITTTATSSTVPEGSVATTPASTNASSNEQAATMTNATGTSGVVEPESHHVPYILSWCRANHREIHPSRTLPLDDIGAIVLGKQVALLREKATNDSPSCCVSLIAVPGSRYNSLYLRFGTARDADTWAYGLASLIREYGRRSVRVFEAGTYTESTIGEQHFPISLSNGYPEVDDGSLPPTSEDIESIAKTKPLRTWWLELGVRCHALPLEHRNIIVCLIDRHPQTGRLEYLNQTEVVRVEDQEDSPVFRKRFPLEFVENASKNLRLNVYDVPNGSKSIEDEYRIGSAEILIQPLVDNVGKEMVYQLSHKMPHKQSRLDATNASISIHCAAKRPIRSMDPFSESVGHDASSSEEASNVEERKRAREVLRSMERMLEQADTFKNHVDGIAQHVTLIYGPHTDLTKKKSTTSTTATTQGMGMGMGGATTLATTATTATAATGGMAAGPTTSPTSESAESSTASTPSPLASSSATTPATGATPATYPDRIHLGCLYWAPIGARPQQMPLKSIVDVFVGKRSSHFNPSVSEEVCFSLVSKSRVRLDLEAKNKQIRDAWVQAIIALLKAAAAQQQRDRMIAAERKHAEYDVQHQQQRETVTSGAPMKAPTITTGENEHASAQDQLSASSTRASGVAPLSEKEHDAVAVGGGGYEKVEVGAGLPSVRSSSMKSDYVYDGLANLYPTPRDLYYSYEKDPSALGVGLPSTRASTTRSMTTKSGEYGLDALYTTPRTTKHLGLGPEPTPKSSLMAQSMEGTPRGEYITPRSTIQPEPSPKRAQ